MFISEPNEEGIVFVTGKQHKYLVTYECEGNIFAVIETAREIFNRMDMSDCYDISILGLRWIKEYTDPMDYNLNGYPSCAFKGTWCCKNPETGKIDPLRMEISLITGDCDVLDVGYGTDH